MCGFGWHWRLFLFGNSAQDRKWVPKMKKSLFLLLVCVMLLTIGGQSTSGYVVDTEVSVNNGLTDWVEPVVAKFFVADDDKKAGCVYKYDSSGNYLGRFELSLSF